MKENYRKQSDEIIARGEGGKLLLHCCCAPCSSACLEYLAGHFDITAYFYNPNITDRAEFDHRAEELIRLTKEMPLGGEVRVVIGEHDSDKFLKIAKGLEELPEGGERCRRCYALRLGGARDMAEKLGSDYVTTTLTISPMKSAETLNAIGRRLQSGRKAAWLPSDFKKKEGYKRSIELSRRYCLYRQNFCGCEFSRRERERKDREKSPT